LKLVVGTHSLFQEKVLFKNLGLVVIDEQHRFGVEQRARMVAKGVSPNVLVMTATPIPRSLALTLYGDLDISVLDEKPPGRLRVITRVRDDSSLRKVEAFCRSEMDRGGQVFYVFPMIEGSEDDDTQAAIQAYERLGSGAFRGYPAVLLHGKMTAAAKERAVAAVRQGRAKLLVATTVVEVGVDLPEASVMVVMHADRFGLAQLHQLRGRVGRAGQQGYAIMMCSPGASPAAMERLAILERTDDGFEIAEADLMFRGAGDLGGLRQWGGGGFRVANPVKDVALLESARKWAVAMTKGEISWKEGEKERFNAWVRSWSERLGSWGQIG
jgi:ATP-dependent DNA helicase RecG